MNIFSKSFLKVALSFTISLNTITSYSMFNANPEKLEETCRPELEYLKQSNDCEQECIKVYNLEMNLLSLQLDLVKYYECLEKCNESSKVSEKLIEKKEDAKVENI